MVISGMNSKSRIIRPAAAEDIPAIMEVLEAAKGIMRSTGNMLQWNDGYPSVEVIEADISRGAGYVMVDDHAAVVAYFAFIPSPEPTYSYIEGGEWLEDTLPYHVIHRIGSYPEVHGVFASLISWCLERDGNLRIDTHRHNTVMQHCIEKAGFSYCGIIYLANGDERLAYQILR